jgi:tetratricopeptide (TPR) repeat protein
VGQEAFKAKNYTEAVKYLAMVSGADASTPSHLKMYAEACSQTKDDFKAYQLYKELSVKTPKDADVLKKLYEIAGKAGTKDEVLLYLKKYTALKPGDVEAQKTLANNLYERKDNAGALAAYRTVVKADPSVKGIYKKYAEIVMAGGNEAEIVTVLNGAIAAGEADIKMYKKLAEIYSKQNNHAKAVAMYEKASQLDPKNASLLNELAESQLKSGNINGAILTYEQAIAMNPQASKEYKTLGDLYLKQKKTDSAIRAYKKYLEKNRDNSAAKLVAENAYKQKNYQEAVKYFAMLSSPESSDPEVLMMYGQACSKTKDEFKAYQIFKQLADVKPRDPVVFEKLYDIASRTGTKDEVLSYLRKYAELKPSDAAAQRKLADMLYEKKDERGALAAYRAALKADSTMKGIYKRYGQLVLASGTDDEKITAFKGAIAANEADGKMYKALGEIYQKRALYDNAIKMFEKASQLDPKDVNILNSLAECQLKKGSLIEATMTYEQIVALKPGAEKEYKQLGDLYMRQKKTDLAVKAYKKYLEKNPADAAIALIVGNTSFGAKNYPDAVKYLGMVTGPESKKASFLAKYAEAAYEAKDYPRAMRIYKELSVLTPKDAGVFKKLAEVCEKTGAPDEALNNLRKYVGLKPGDAEAQKAIGDALYDRKDMNGALQAYRSALKYNPSLKGFYKRYVELVMKSSSKADEKITALNGAINAGEADASMYGTLADLYKAAANYPRAIKMYEKASQLDPKNSKLLSSLAECQMKSGSLNEAAINLEQAIALNPSASTEYKQLGDLYMLQKKTDAAMGAYKKYLAKTSDSKIASLVAKNAYQKKNYADAFKYYGMVKDDNSSEFIVEYGLSALKQKKYKTAISTLEKIRTMKGTIPQKNVALKSLAEAYQKNGEALKAAEILNEYVKLPGVKDPDASFSRAVAYETINPKMAVQMYEENVKAYPRDYRNFLKLGIYYSRQSNSIQTAAKYLERCAAITDTIGRVWLELGGLYAKLKRDQDMLRAYRKFLEIDPENAEASAKIGEILLAKKMTEDAMVFLEMANALKENDPKLMTLLARGYIMTNRRDEGAKLLEKVIKLSKGNIDDELRIELINVYLESNQFAKAADELKVMIAKKRDKDLLVKYARAVYELGRYKEVESIVADIKAVDPENLEAYMMLGKAKVAQKKYDDAIETYKEVLYIDQNYAPALCERANVYLIQGKLQWAKTFYDRALKADPKNGLVHLGLAKLAKQQKDYTTYSDHLDKARKLSPNSKEVQDELKTVRR